MKGRAKGSEGSATHRSTVEGGVDPSADFVEALVAAALEKLFLEQRQKLRGCPQLPALALEGKVYKRGLGLLVRKRGVARRRMGGERKAAGGG